MPDTQAMYKKKCCKIPQKRSDLRSLQYAFKENQVRNPNPNENRIHFHGTLSTDFGKKVTQPIVSAMKATAAAEATKKRRLVSLSFGLIGIHQM